MHFDRSLTFLAGLPARLSPRVTRVLAPNPSPFTFKGTGVYLVEDGDDVIAIDPGPDMPEHIAALKRVIGTRKLRAILITHTHRDHSPAARALKAWSGATVYAAAPAPHAAANEGQVDEAHDHDFVPDVIVKDGERVAGLTCVATPGHTANHMCFALEAEKALFSGDHVMGWSTSVIAPPDGDMAAYLESLERLRTRNDQIYYPTHGSPIADPQGWLRDLIAHRHERAAQVADAVVSGSDTIETIAAQLYPDLDPALRSAAKAQVKAHLDLLEKQRRVMRDGVRYRPL